MGIIWLIFCIVVGVFANARGRSGIGWGLLAAIISPLLAGIILAIMRDLSLEKGIDDINKKIDNTMSEVKYNQRINDYKQQQLEKQLDYVQRQSDNIYLAGRQGTNSIGMKEPSIVCKNCGVIVNGNPKFCPHCSTKLKEEYKCSSCNKEIDKDIKFCPHCGEKNAKTVTCSSCGTENEKNVKFCINCGNNMSIKKEEIKEEIIEEEVN